MRREGDWERQGVDGGTGGEGEMGRVSEKKMDGEKGNTVKGGKC